MYHFTPTVIKEPPYEITETGYASFDVIIEVFFRNKAEPRSIRFLYDLYIEMDKPVYKLRRERLTFKNPSKDFMKKLIMGGGTIMVGDIHHIRKFTFSARISLLFSLLRRATTRWRVIRLSEVIFETTLLFDHYGIFRKSLVRDSSFPLSLFVHSYPVCLCASLPPTCAKRQRQEQKLSLSANYKVSLISRIIIFID